MDPSDEQLLIALGRVAANGIACEQATTILLGGFVLGDRERVLPVIAGHSWSRQLDAIRSFLFVLDDRPELAEKLKKWLILAKECRVARNRAIHSAHMTSEDGFDTFSLQLQPNGRARVHALDARNLNDIADRLRHMHEACRALMDELGETQLWSSTLLIARED